MNGNFKDCFPIVRLHKDLYLCSVTSRSPASDTLLAVERQRNSSVCVIKEHDLTQISSQKQIMDNEKRKINFCFY